MYSFRDSHTLLILIPNKTTANDKNDYQQSAQNKQKAPNEKSQERVKIAAHHLQ